MSASVVYRSREIWAGGLGVKSREHGGYPDSTTVYRIASVSKVFVVIADQMECCAYIILILMTIGYHGASDARERLHCITRRRTPKVHS